MILTRVESRVPWTELLRQELLPFHGRLAGALRTTLASCCALVLMMVLQTPAVAPGLYLIFLISYETPYLSFRSSVSSLFFQSVGVAAALLLVILFGNDPMARVLGTAAFSFIAAFLLRACARPGVGMNFGVFSLTSLALWDAHAPAEQLVHNCLWPVATGAIGVSCAVAVEYLFTRRDPFYALKREFEVRMQSLETFFRTLRNPDEQIAFSLSARKIVQFAFAGQGKMLALLQEVGTRHDGSEEYLENLPLLLPLLGRVLDLSANLALELSSNQSPLSATQTQYLADLCYSIRERREVIFIETENLKGEEDALTEIGRVLREMQSRRLAAPTVARVKRTHSGKKGVPPWFVPDAWTNPEYVVFGLKIALCSTLCYVLYMALNWPGISTAVLTVLITGLSSTAAISQKMIFRWIGSALGGVIFGIGSMVLLFPNMELITSLVLLVGSVTFIASWVARSPHFGYIGFQIAFSFYLVAFETFSIPTSMAPGRDRLIGIAIALLVMWAIFFQVKPEKTVSKMRAVLAKALNYQSKLVSLESEIPEREAKGARLRELIARELVAVRSMAELLPYEIGMDRKRSMEEGERILQAGIAAGSLFFHISNSRETTASADSTKAILASALEGWAAYLQGSTEKQPILSLSQSLKATELVDCFSSLEHELNGICLSRRRSS